jgi:thioredoxin 1
MTHLSESGIEEEQGMDEVSTDTFEERVMQSEKPVLVDFWGPQCGPCLALMPQIDKLAEKYKDSISVVKVEAPKNRRLCLSLKILSLPTLLVYHEGKELSRICGNVSTELVENQIRTVIQLNREP